MKLPESSQVTRPASLHLDHRRRVSPRSFQLVGPVLVLTFFFLLGWKTDGQTGA